MISPTELWKKWEGNVVDKKFPLRRWLGGSEHSAVFLTERSNGGSQKAAVKLILAGDLDEDAQLSRWASAEKLSHPHLIRLFECGRCQIDGTRLLYVVMEYAEEDLAQILPLRPLSPSEVSELLPPTAEVLGSLHQAGFTHGRVKPSNIMAVDNGLKISADGLRKSWEPAGARVSGAYDAPEVATVGLSPAADIWSLGITLVAVLTQKEPQRNTGDGGEVVPESIPQPFREIARQCLQIDPKLRCTADDIRGQFQMPAATGAAKKVQVHAPPKRWMAVPIVVAVLFLVGWLGSKFVIHQPPVPAAETGLAHQPPAVAPAAQSPAPFSGRQKPVQKGVARGSVLQQVLPDVSLSAQNTITGRVKVSVQVAVDAAGNVAQEKLVSPGPSQYFANRALAAARRWKFNPPQVNGQPTASEWVLRFQFGRASTQVFPAETKP